MSRSLRPFQAEALASLDVPEIHLLLTAPTGSGKGVILEEIAKRNERVLLITPLIALARQQARRFSSHGIRYHSSVGRGGAIDPGPSPDDRAWLLSPESATLPRRMDQIRKWHPTLIAIDEAHCLEEWGEAFRPAYAGLIPWIREIRAKRTLWMSATFPRSLVERLERGIPGSWKKLGSFSLPSSLSLTIERVAYADRIEKVHARIIERKSPGILFAGTRKASENYARLFRSATGPHLIPYHAGMSDEERRGIESLLEACREGPSSPSVVATNAFGMGMDFPQLEWALIAQTPLSLLSLMQAFGRVARAGRPGTAEILWAEEDFRIAGYLVSRGPNRENAEARLSDLRLYLEGGALARRDLLSRTFL